MAAPYFLEFRARHSGEVIFTSRLYDFLKQLHTQSPNGGEFSFEELQIVVDGEELLPTPGGHA